jgi:hypothetical protein
MALCDRHKVGGRVHVPERCQSPHHMHFSINNCGLDEGWNLTNNMVGGDMLTHQFIEKMNDILAR